jgi:hypothetical protein
MSMVALHLSDYQLLGYLASILALKHKLTLLSGGGVDGMLPDQLEFFFQVLTEKATIEYEVNDLDSIRLEACKALRLSAPKNEQVFNSFVYFDFKSPLSVRRQACCTLCDLCV